MIKNPTLSESLKKRLKAYSLTAGAVAAGATAMHAQVDYTDLDPDAVASNTDTVYLDLNNDGTNDFVFLASFDTYGSGALNIYKNFAVALGSNAIVGSATSSGYLYPYAIPSGSIINGNAAMNSGSNFQTLGWDYFTASGSAAYTFGNIRVGSGDAYLGLRLDLNGATHYGWARVSLELGGTLTLKDYAYEQTSCVGIEAGAMTGGLTATPAPTASNIVAVDNGNVGDGTDILVTFDVATSEAGVSEYRVFAVKAVNAGSFDLATASAVADYKSVTPTGSAISTDLSGTNDSDGDAIMINNAYAIFVLSVNDCADAQTNALTASSETVTITPPVGVGELNQFGYSLFAQGNSIVLNSNVNIESMIVTGIDGKVVKTLSNIQGNQTIDLGVARGVYIVNISTAKGSSSEKVFLN
ncbi:MAG: T9SS type A sorting domain-containing protein [Salibacteraceae bacterium]|jgi:hypothetical protein|nr:T9SS type A sorting domain-containing protein [Salibacteraceae bacterium]MDP4687642.1 T9SS type A sorting domain-containing protein [Salibacteraceae bacterium]MDP4762959.1 T9SS type A sorting domain-containing protein [Salibacteraceae bacterium]MDP4844448.1 T9SS type A sorting domain-containing protein [Salibacteraceae bacterium]MDP4965521.1 T9SS type A sorting domain-containing protein [Salibacteraceae bacterium]